jgi:uncharacterized protein (TIGR02246 family)
MHENSSGKLTRCGAVLGCATAALAGVAVLVATDSNATLSDPRRAAQVYSEATRWGDADAIARLYAVDAVLMLPGTPLISGRNAIRNVHLQKAFDGRSSIEFTDVHMTNRGQDHAVVMWKWRSRTFAPSGEAKQTSGRSLVYFKKHGEGWLISADMQQVDGSAR